MIGDGRFFCLCTAAVSREILEDAGVHNINLGGVIMGFDWKRVYASRAAKMQASEIRDAFNLTERSDIISFAGGFPTPDVFPGREIGTIAESICRQEADRGLQYGPTEGLIELRDELSRLMRSEGIDASAENILITNGSQQGLDLIFKVLLDPGDKVLVDLPAYIGGLGAIANYEGDALGVAGDENGILPGELEKTLSQLAALNQVPKAAYLVPNFQNPSGVTMALDRRKVLLSLSRKYGFVVLEDDPYGKVRFEGQNIPHIKSMDVYGNVVYLGSFSKMLIPGLRLGWVVADRELVRKLSIAKQATDLCTNSFGQKIVLRYLRSGLLQEHLGELRETYKPRRDRMLQALSEYAPSGVTWTVPKGGFFILMTLPEYMDARSLLPLAVKAGVAYVPGKAFFVNGYGANTLRLAYSQARLDQIEDGISRLCSVVREEMEKVAAENRAEMRRVLA